MTYNWVTVWAVDSISLWGERPDPDAYVGMGLFVAVSILDEALAAKERAEVERDEAKEEASKLWQALFWIDRNDPELTAVAEKKFGLDMEGHLLSHPTTEPAKAEEEP